MFDHRQIGRSAEVLKRAGFSSYSLRTSAARDLIRMADAYAVPVPDRVRGRVAFAVSAGDEFLELAPNDVLAIVEALPG
jgi:hypothetical protein